MRKTLIGLRLILCILLLAGIIPYAYANGVLRVLAWPGYAEPEVINEFERQHKVAVKLTVIDSDNALWTKIDDQNSQFDVFAVNPAELQRHIKAGHVQPINPMLIPNISRQLPRFRELSSIDGLVNDRQVYGIPYTYSTMGLIYDKSQFNQPPESISVLWNADYRGKVVLYNGGTHNFTLAAQKLGDPDPFQLSAEEIPPAVNTLIALRRNALGFYNRPEDSVTLFLKHNAAIMFANYGMQQLHMLRAAGADVGYSIPREGALAWLDCWAITRNADNKALAHAWINHMLDKTASRLLVERQGLNNTISTSGTDTAQGPLMWLKPVENAPYRELLWNRIRSGDRASRVLRP